MSLNLKLFTYQEGVPNKKRLAPFLDWSGSLSRAQKNHRINPKFRSGGILGNLYFDPDKNLYQEMIRRLQLLIQNKISLIWRKMLLFPDAWGRTLFLFRTRLHAWPLNFPGIPKIKMPTSKSPWGPEEIKALKLLAKYTIAMFSFPIIAYFFVKQHICEELAGYEDGTMPAVVCAVAVVNVIIASYIWTAIQEEREEGRRREMDGKNDWNFGYF